MIKAYFSDNIEKISKCPYSFNFRKEKSYFFKEEVFLDENKIIRESEYWIVAGYDAVIKVNKND